VGCVLSGAGPSLLAAAPSSAEAVGQAMERALAEAGFRGTARVLPVDQAGTVWEVEQGS